MKCEFCDGSGLIPLKNKDGKIIPYAWTYCQCRQEPEEHYTPLTIDDFDFPMSDTFRGYSFTQCGVPDPGYIPPSPDLSVIEHRLEELEAKISEPGRIPRKYQYQLQQLQGRVNYLQNKLNEHIDIKRREKPARGVIL